MRIRRKSSLLVGLTAIGCLVVAFVALGSLRSPQVRSATAETLHEQTGTLLTPPDVGSWAADAAVPQVQIFTAPDQPSGQTLERTPEDAPLVFLVKRQQGNWIQVQLPERPNGATAWVRASDVRLRHVSQRIVVKLSAHTVTLFDHGKAIASTPSVVGAPASPTPTGSFYVTSVIHLDNPYGAYGVGAFGLAAFSDVYETFGGGPGQVGIHGTNAPQLVGQSVSHGCVRVPNDVWANLAQHVVTGTPVVIEA